MNIKKRCIIRYTSLLRNFYYKNPNLYTPVAIFYPFSIGSKIILFFNCPRYIHLYIQFEKYSAAIYKIERNAYTELYAEPCRTVQSGQFFSVNQHKQGCRVGRRISAPASHRTVRESLPSHGSSYSTLMRYRRGYTQ
ncbi:MAG: hypothetical protein LBG96_02725, partial [Tannerella sp.]|nr:hypothetical protein [Tannerella sp.]